MTIKKSGAMKAPRFEVWRNSSKKYNYRMRGRNGKAIENHTQGWERISGVINNITAIYAISGQHITFLRKTAGKVAVEFMFPDSRIVNMYWVDAPGTKKAKK